MNRAVILDLGAVWEDKEGERKMVKTVSPRASGKEGREALSICAELLITLSSNPTKLQPKASYIFAGLSTK